MSKIETLVDDESYVLNSGIHVDEVVERALESNELADIISRFIRGEMTQHKLYDELFNLTFDLERSIEKGE